MRSVPKKYLFGQSDSIFTLQDVGLLVSDEDDEEVVKGLVNVADMVCLDRGVLLS